MNETISAPFLPFLGELRAVPARHLPGRVEADLLQTLPAGYEIDCHAVTGRNGWMVPFLQARMEMSGVCLRADLASLDTTPT